MSHTISEYRYLRLRWSPRNKWTCTWHSEKHETVWNRCHYGVTTGGSKRGTSGCGIVRSLQLSELRHLRLPVVYWWTSFSPRWFREHEHEVLVFWNSTQSSGGAIPSCKMSVWCAINKQGLIEPILIKGAITNLRYLQKLQNDVIAVFV